MSQVSKAKICGSLIAGVGTELLVYLLVWIFDHAAIHLERVFTKLFQFPFFTPDP